MKALLYASVKGLMWMSPSDGTVFRKSMYAFHSSGEFPSVSIFLILALWSEALSEHTAGSVRQFEAMIIVVKLIKMIR